MKSKQSHFLIGIVMIGIIFLIITFNLASKPALGWLFFCLFVLSVIAFFIVMLISIPDYRKNREIQYQIYKQKDIERKKGLLEYRNQKKSFIDLFGEISNELSLAEKTFYGHNDPKITETVFVFESTSKLVINTKILDFSDLIAFELKSNEQIIYKSSVSTSKSSASTGSMIGRAVVGGVLFGGVGAVVGGATATKNTTTINSPQQANVTHNYKIHIIVNSITEPQIVIDLRKNEEAANELVAVLSVILERKRLLNLSL